MRTTPRIFCLDDFGLTLPKLRRLGSRPVTLKADLRYAGNRGLLTLEPAERMRRIEESFERKARQAERQWPTDEYEVLRPRRNGRPYAIRSVVPASLVPRLLDISALDSIWIEAIEGIRRRKRKAEPRWFTVHGRYAIQVEDQRRGVQDYEERFVSVKATTFDEAKAKVRRESRFYATPYINPYGELVRWQLEEIVDVYDTMLETLDGDCVEVFSTLKTRRMRPDRVWRPRRRA